MSSFLMRIFPVVCALSVTVRAAVLSIDPAYKNWEKLFATDGYVRVPVYIEEAKYTGAGQAACIQTIKDAVAAMNTGLNGCVQFIILPSPVNVGRPFLWISNSLNNK
ncbi:hypothetical protein BV898_18928 [Hypsibius exemplaris]|uniref:Uncharacterized protein n=1 Tax=Hypsibius exemplaris TaxID=2072580 RepID=A0A9X6RNM0_HYPEX|nr:hypothetical protein BV898_18928 [Hypsibius exemplaris]